MRVLESDIIGGGGGGGGGYRNCRLQLMVLRGKKDISQCRHIEAAYT